MPAEVQEVYEAERSDEALLPIVLIHDGGGTVFQYFMLGYLGRQTYAIANPYFESGTIPGGGLPALAKEYVTAIEQELGKGPVIIGGQLRQPHMCHEAQDLQAGHLVAS